MFLRQAVRNVTKKRKPIRRGAMRPLSARPQGTHIIGQPRPKPRPTTNQYGLPYDINQAKSRQPRRRTRRYI